MQKAEHDFFTDRAVLYKAFLIIKGKQEMERTKEFQALPRDIRESKRYELPETVSIWICDFDLSGSRDDEYIDEWALYSRNALKKGSVAPVFGKNKYIMISLPKFKKSESEVSGSVDAWLYLLNHAGDGKELPHFGNEILEEALERIRVDNADDELLTKQERDMVTREEIDTIIASGIRRGTEKACAEACAKASADGRAEGLAKGRAEGRAEGLAKGRAEGRAEGIDILESLGVPANLIEKARKIVAEKLQDELK